MTSNGLTDNAVILAIEDVFQLMIMQLMKDVFL